jgi:hypothetical protein
MMMEGLATRARVSLPIAKVDAMMMEGLATRPTASLPIAKVDSRLKSQTFLLRVVKAAARLERQKKFQLRAHPSHHRILQIFLPFL